MINIIEIFRNFISENRKKHSDLAEKILYMQDLENNWNENKGKFPIEIRELLDSLKFPGDSQLVLMNDDVTPMEYVVLLLEGLFGFDEEKAKQLMLECHEKGRVVAAENITTDAAEKIVLYMRGHAESRGYPLSVVIESA